MCAGRETTLHGTLPSCARRVIRAHSLLAPESWREYPARTSLVSPLHTGVVLRHARATSRVLFMSFMNTKSLVNCFVWNHQYFEKNEQNKNILGMPQRILPDVYVHSSLLWSFIVKQCLFKLILRFEIVF